MMRPGLRAFVILPLLANIVVMGGCTLVVVQPLAGGWLMDKVLFSCSGWIILSGRWR